MTKELSNKQLEELAIGSTCCLITTGMILQQLFRKRKEK